MDKVWNMEALLDALARRSRKFGLKRLSKPALRAQWARPIRCCTFCSAFPDSYMVENSVWEEAGFDKRELVCLSCLRLHLGRSLKIEDFTEAPVNQPIFLGFMLGQQYGRDQDRPHRTLSAKAEAPTNECNGKAQAPAEGRWDVV